MPRNLEDAALPKVLVGGKSFPIGPVTIFQIFSAKNFVVGILTEWRIRNAKRTAQLATKAMQESMTEHEDIRAKVAATLGISTEDVDEAAFYQGIGTFVQNRIKTAEGEMGYSDDSAGVLIDIIGMLSERQIAEFARLLLDRTTDTRVTLEFIEKHFNLEWFLEALGYLLQHNHVPTLIKNFQRLGIMFNMQTETPAETSENLATTKA